ncbi:hypothetical protein chiPu_0024211, partial [Chiloscyllium punctatum]|nr:hypothetical protein [Chiloscyllium punctatum]
ILLDEKFGEIMHEITTSVTASQKPAVVNNIQAAS